MATISQVRGALRDALDNIPGLVPYSTEVGQIVAPAAVVVTPDVDFHQSFGSQALNRMQFRVLVLVAQSLTETAAAQLDTYVDPASAVSVRAVIEADTTLGGVVETLIVDQFRPLGVEEAAALGYWGGEFLVTVYAR